MKNRRRSSQKTSRRYSTAGGRELRLKARPPARFSSQPVIKELTSINNKETKTTVPSGNSYFWHIESPQNRSPGNSYFWRTAAGGTIENSPTLKRWAIFAPSLRDSTPGRESRPLLILRIITSETAQSCSYWSL